MPVEKEVRTTFRCIGRRAFYKNEFGEKFCPHKILRISRIQTILMAFIFVSANKCYLIFSYLSLYCLPVHVFTMLLLIHMRLERIYVPTIKFIRDNFIQARIPPVKTSKWNRKKGLAFLITFLMFSSECAE